MRFTILCLAALLAACQTAPTGYWYRQSDGVRVDANSNVLDQFQKDRAICDGEAAKAALASNEKDVFIHKKNVNLVFDGCLTERGYVRR